MTSTIQRTSVEDPRLTAMGLLMETTKGLWSLLEPQLKQHGLNGTEFEVQLRLLRSPGQRLRMSDLAAQTALSTSGITRVVDRLERDGLVRRESCASDRRGFWAALTPAGEERITATLDEHTRLIEQYFTGQLTTEELDDVINALRKVRDVVRPGAVAGVAADV
jgi:MarR family 2-MHQ and catechol resistance regulon transcriptional repressor